MKRTWAGCECISPLLFGSAQNAIVDFREGGGVYIIADLTRANLDSIPSVLNRLPRNDNNAYVLEVAILPRQRPELPNTSFQKVSEIDESADVGSQVCQVLKSRLAEFADERFVVLSFNSYVLSYCHKLDEASRDRVQSIPWGQARTLRDADGNLLASSGNGGVWPSSISEEHACKALIEVLKDANAYDKSTGIRQTALRPKLSAKDSRLSTEHTSSVRNFISKLVRRAASRGLIQLDAPGTNPIIWTAADVSHSTEQLASVVSRQQRGQLFIDTLKSGKMGPFPNFREKVFSAVEEMVVANDKPLFRDLLGAAVSNVRNNCNGSHNGFSWSSVKEFLIELFRLHPVAMDANSQALRPGFSTWNTPIASMVDDWRLKLDGELVLYLLRKGCEINFYDIPELTGALYETREEVYQNRLYEVITLLKNSGKIEFDQQDSAIKLASS